MNLVLMQYLVIGAVLFTIGMIGFLTRRNMIIMFLCAELMLQGVVVNLVAFSRYHNNLQGQAFVVFILTVAACEAAIALALVVALYTKRKTLDVSACSVLNERSEIIETVDVVPPWAELISGAEPEPSPELSPAGIPPTPQEAVERTRHRSVHSNKENSTRA
jgi:NADH-quinone oxidoreductase subunit K